MADVDTRPRSTPLQSDFNYPQQRTSSLDDALAGPSNIASYSNNSVAGPSNSVSSDPQDQLTSDFGMSAGGSSLYGGLLNGANSLDLTSSHHDNPLFTSGSSLSAVLPTLPDGLLQLPEVLDEDLSASSRLEFPDIPAMLFEQAPEYEYSAHTRANVFSDASLDRLVAGALSGYDYSAPLGSRSPPDNSHPNLWNQMTDVPGPSDDGAFQPQQFANGRVVEQPANGSVSAPANANANFLADAAAAAAAEQSGASSAHTSGYPQPHAPGAHHSGASLPQHHSAYQQQQRIYPDNYSQRYSEPMAAPMDPHAALDERAYQRSLPDVSEYGADGQPVMKRRRGSPSPRAWSSAQDTSAHMSQRGSYAFTGDGHNAGQGGDGVPPLSKTGPSPSNSYASLPHGMRSGPSPAQRYSAVPSQHAYAADWASAGPSALGRAPPSGYHHPHSSPSGPYAMPQYRSADPSQWNSHSNAGMIPASGTNGSNSKPIPHRSQRQESSASLNGGDSGEDGEDSSLLDAPPPTERAVSLAQAALKGGNGTAQQADMLAALNDTLASSLETDGVARCPFPECTKTFAKNRSYNLKTHLRSHSQLKPFACSSCPRAFSRKHDLERHARVHSGDKPYICEVCGRGFPRSDALRRHWRVEKECGDKASEIEAGQPLPSLAPGAVGMHAHVAMAAMPMSMVKGMVPSQGGHHLGGHPGAFAAPTALPGSWHHGGGGQMHSGPQYGVPPQSQGRMGGPPPGGPHHLPQQQQQQAPPGFVPLPPSHHLSVGSKRPREEW